MKKIAIIHEWLTFNGGAERVLKELLQVFPEADLFTLVDFLPETERGFLKKTKITTSFLQKIPLIKKYYRLSLSLMTHAVESFDVSDYDIVISSNHCVAKGVLTGPDQLHICICHSPVRYAWDMQHEYLEQAGLSRGIKGFVARRMLHHMRIWDSRTSNGVDHFVAVSHFIKRRIEKTYRRCASVIHSPVEVEAFELSKEKEDFYLTASRLVPYKKIGLVIEAFRHAPSRKLVVIGDGPEWKKIAKSVPTNVHLLGYQSFDVLKDYLKRAKAFIFAPKEDFGIIPIEAQACGTPVIAYGKGGALETVQGLSAPEPTGIFFQQQSTSSILEAINTFEQESHLFKPEACRKNAERFSSKKYRSKIKAFVDKALIAHQQKLKLPQDNLDQAPNHEVLL